MTNHREELLRKLSEAFGPPGFEGDVRKIIADELGSFCEVSYDNIGSIICEKKGRDDGLKVMLAAHMDEVAFMVQSVRDDGCASFVPLGGLSAEELPGTIVTLRTHIGDLRGVIGSIPVHFKRGMSASDKPKVRVDDLFIDFGAKDKADASRFGVQPGTPCVPSTSFSELKPGNMCLGKAWDDRAGVATMIEALKGVRDEALSCSVFGVGTVQEEIGAKGAITSANMIEPDLAIILEGSPASDTVKAGSSLGSKLGNGPQIRFYDPSMMPSRSLVEMLADIAEAHNIQHQLVVRRSGGTDGQRIQLAGRGVPCVVVSVVCRYVHSPAGVIARSDFDHTVDLISCFLRDFSRKKYEQVISF
ncbi:M20/M25/M40 family metallo-hydrolase [bacterium]|nr:M20/M25/M40 family metallo-hydrolase [bacterium]